MPLDRITSSLDYARAGAAFTGAGADVRGAATVDDVLIRAGLDFELATAPIRNETTGRTIKGRVSVYRTDTGHDLGVVGAGYQPIAPGRILEAFGAIVKDAGLSFHSAGAFDHGARVWIQAEWPEGYSIVGEQHRQFLTGQSGNDGGLALRLGTTDIRIVCRNTFQMAGRDLSVTIRHSGDTNAKITGVGDLIQVTSEARARFVDWAERAALVPVRGAEYAPFEVALFGLAADAIPADDKRVTVFRSIAGEEKSLNGGKLSVYGLFNAITGYADHGVRTRGGAEGRWDSVLNGAAAAFKARGAKMVMELSK